VFGAVQLKAREGGGRGAEDPAAIQAQLGQGRPLDGGVRTRMEAAFGGDLGPVHLHTGATASRVASGLNARAFTVGRHVAFGAGEYRPGTPAGDALIAHEVAHVVQQRSAASAEAPLEAGSARYDALEHDADHAAAGAVASLWGGVKEVARNTGPALRSGLRLQRCATFSEHSSQEYQGFDASTNPRGLVVPEEGERIVDVRKKGELTFKVVPDPERPSVPGKPEDVAEVHDETPADGITVTGKQHGGVMIVALEGTKERARLCVSVKKPRTPPIDVAYHFISDDKHATERKVSEEKALTEKLNEVWQRQANVEFNTVHAMPVPLTGNLGSLVDYGGAGWDSVTTAVPRVTYAWNVFLVWKLKPYKGKDVNGVTAGVGGDTMIADKRGSDDLTLAHEAGHYMGLVPDNDAHPFSSIMASGGGLERQRVTKAQADFVNP
jgi:hypothetical protein